MRSSRRVLSLPFLIFRNAACLRNLFFGFNDDMGTSLPWNGIVGGSEGIFWVYRGRNESLILFPVRQDLPPLKILDDPFCINSDFKVK